MAARKRITHLNNGRKRDRDRDKEQTPRSNTSGPYWRNMTPELERGTATVIPSVVKGKPSNGIQSASVIQSNRLPKSGGSRARIEGRVTPSSRNSLEMGRKMSAVPQLFVEVATATAATQSLRKSSTTDSSRTKTVDSTLGTNKATIDPSPATSPRTGLKSAGLSQSKLEDYEKIPTRPSSASSSPWKTVSPLKVVTPKASAKQLLTSPPEEPPEDDNIQPDNDDQSDEKDQKKVEDFDGQKMAMCTPNMKLFPCFRGEYPTRHRPGTYQWLQRSGPQGSQVMAVCECDDDQTITTEGNIIASCEVTEAHFLSVDCDDENKIGAPPGSKPCNEFNSTNFDTGATSYMYTFPQSVAGPPDMDGYQPQIIPCPAMQQHHYQHQPQSPCRLCCPNRQTQQNQTVCFSMQPEKQQRFPNGNAKSNPNGNGLTEMLAQQLQQQMQQAQAQIAQVQMQLNSACGTTRVRKLQVLSHSTQNVAEPLPEEEEQEKQDEDEAVEEEDADMESPDDNGNNKYTDLELPCACIAEQFRLQQQQQQQQQHQHQFQQQATYFCGPPTIQATAPQPFLFPYQPPLSSSAPLQFGCYPMPFAPQEQQCPPIPTISCPYQSQQPQQLPQQPSNHQSHLQQQSSQSNSQQNMCPHGNHFCPSCSYRQRYAQMRFMMPRCWPR